MIPILYESTETAFTSNGICRLRDCLSFIVTEERNGIYEANFEYPITGANYKEIRIGRIVAATHDDSGDVQPFDIVSYSAPINGVVSFHAVHISYRLNKITISPSFMTVANGGNSYTPTGAMSLAKNGLGVLGSHTSYPTCPFTFNSDITTTKQFNFEDGRPLTMRQLLGGVDGSVLDKWNCELEFNKFIVNIWKQRGTSRDFNIRYGLNMTDYTDEADDSEAFNSVSPYWVGEYNGLTNFVKQLWHVDSGADLPDGRTACVPLDLTDQFESIPTDAQLTTAAQNYMNENKPYNTARTITVSFIRLQDLKEYEMYDLLMSCNLCDTVGVIFPEYGTNTRMKIVQTEYDVLADRYNSMELGSLSTTLSEALGMNDIGGGSGGGGIIPDDYVTETGTGTGASAIWTYRKWKSGIKEVWGRYSASIAINTSSAGYGGYRSGNLSLPTFPITFTSAPTGTATAQSTGGYWVNNLTPTTNGGSFYLSCGQSQAASNRTIAFHFIGK